MCSEVVSDKNLNARLNFILLDWSFCWRLGQDLGKGQMIHLPTMICFFCYRFLRHLDILWGKITVLDGAGFAVLPQKLKVECVSHHASHDGEFKDTQSHSMWCLPRIWWDYFKIIAGIDAVSLSPYKQQMLGVDMALLNANYQYYFCVVD